MEQTLKLRIESQAELVRSMKAEKASKEEVGIAVAELLALKQEFESLTGKPFDAKPKPVAMQEKEKKETEAAKEGSGAGLPSKKELNKMEKKKKREEHSSLHKPIPHTEEKDMKTSLLTVHYFHTPAEENETSSSSFFFPLLSATVAAMLKTSITFMPSSHNKEQERRTPHLPYLTSPNQRGSLSGDATICRHILRTQTDQTYSSSSSSCLLFMPSKEDVWQLSQIDQWLDLYSSRADPATLSSLLDQHLEERSYLVGSALTVADVAMALSLRTIAVVSPQENSSSSLPHLHRWLRHVRTFLPSVSIPSTSSSAAASAAGKASGKKGGNEGGKKSAANSGSGALNADDGGACPPLEEAIEGQVVTRFPPEPSGYLHIGHAKAVLLNQYYAQRYRGKLLVRFDDTNPSKEKEEFEENILTDLATLGVIPDSVSHTSDHFETCQRLAREMISKGLAYMDNTDQERMQAERMTHTESKCRNTSVEENLSIFEAMLKGEGSEAQSYCLRAKIDMKSVNGTMRDPVLYRYNGTPHHRTGSKYKAYPTYDFACPIVDSVEGVTHALRTTEYNDRDEQFHWLQNALGLRRVHIYSFGKMNFVHTVLSKRKLTWFVEQKLVDGWFDPRFPTIQGCVRRGMNVDALKSFILSQGASRRIITMEWDKFWSENKKLLEESAHRYMAVAASNAVPLIVSNFGDLYPDGSTEVAATTALHPQKPELGSRVMRRAARLLLEPEDCVALREGEEVTLLRWGNFIIEKIVRESGGDAGPVSSITARHDPEAKNFSKTKKLTWLADTLDNVKCRLVEFDHLISKAKLGDEENFQNFVNPKTRFESFAVGDACLRTVKVGQVIQLERRGFFRCDEAFGDIHNTHSEAAITLFYIPDGKMKAPAAAPGPSGK